jgi:hypothetical protein
MTTPVLLVEADPAARRRFGSWLELHGFDVMACPGPTEPEYECIGARGERPCPLASEASIVVLDMSLDGEAVMQGTAAEDLLGMYLSSGHRVVVLGSRSGADVPGRLVHLRRHPERADLLLAVWSLVEAASMEAASRTAVEDSP